jgi:beta-xylosidase
LNCIPKPLDSQGLWNVPNLLLQKFPAEEFTATAKLVFNARTDNEEVGFLVMGEDYQFISLKKVNGKLWIKTIKCNKARTGGKEEELFSEEISSNEIFFRIKVEKGALCTFQFSSDGKSFKTAGPEFEAKPGRWIGAKVGFFALREGVTNDSGTVDIDWFRIE